MDVEEELPRIGKENTFGEIHLGAIQSEFDSIKLLSDKISQQNLTRKEDDCYKKMKHLIMFSLIDKISSFIICHSLLTFTAFFVCNPIRFHVFHQGFQEVLLPEMNCWRLKSLGVLLEFVFYR